MLCPRVLDLLSSCQDLCKCVFVNESMLLLFDSLCVFGNSHSAVYPQNTKSRGEFTQARDVTVGQSQRRNSTAWDLSEGPANHSAANA